MALVAVKVRRFIGTVSRNLQSETGINLLTESGEELLYD
jgi:hypothetical protein